MASFTQGILYGVQNTDNAKGSLSMQWHVTTECDQRCKHCYVFESETYKDERRNTLSTELCFKLIDDFNKILERLNITGTMQITGGDPLLRLDIWELLSYIKSKKRISVSMMGNPFHVNDYTAERLKKMGVKVYQISIDGLEETHDKFRKPGSFKESLRALECLNKNGIATNVMFTLSKTNMNELIDLYNFLSKLDFINSFSFDRLVPLGKGNELIKDGMMTANEHKELLYKMFINEIGTKSSLMQGRKDALWPLLLHEIGVMNPLLDKSRKFCNGCGVPYNLITVLADGTIYSCRRLNKALGRFPNDNIWEVFINSEFYNEIRDIEKHEKCNQCELGGLCFGCPAIKYGYNGDVLKPDPHCWKCS